MGPYVEVHDGLVALKDGVETVEESLARNVPRCTHERVDIAAWKGCVFSSVSEKRSGWGKDWWQVGLKRGPRCEAVHLVC